DQRTNAPVDPFGVDWSALTAPQFNQRFRLRQDPGPANALGDVKFMFPNVHNVYLHDTPSRELFARTDRSFSSGCIRVERPLELAAHLLEGLPGWDPQRIRASVARRVETTVTLLQPVPVHLQYWTAFLDDDGRLNYRRDLYQRDAAVLDALRADPPGV
ncbi:MAG: L,D-transpeptidase family protein, partial [Longimicrobiales bacterium]